MKKPWILASPKGELFDVEWSDDTNFEDLKNIMGVVGFVFDDSGKFCIVKWKRKKKWLVTGGGTEKEDKTPEDTLIREVEEEADLEIKNIQRVGYMILSKKDKPEEKFYSLRYVARLSKINPQTIDPAYNEITQRKFIFPEEFEKYCGWGENGEFQLKKVLDVLKKN
jgi:8-oxo-dGTP pyrophosphatase MutT (NUDIX family)